MKISFIKNMLRRPFIVALSTLCTHTAFSANKPTKIVIFTSKGGYGHMAACSTLKTFLPEYDVKIVNPFEEVFNSLDIVKKITFGKLDYEMCYNKLMQNGWTRTINFITRYPGWGAVRLTKKSLEHKIYNFLRAEKPDLLLSLIPLINYPASTAAQRCNIPFLLMTLDMDLTTWLLDMEKCKHPNFHMTVVSKTPRIIKQLAQHHIADSKVTSLGFHLRPDFFEKKDAAQICTTWNLPTDKPKIMLMMGGVGTEQLTGYAKKLLQLPFEAHLMVCAGKNTQLAAKLKSFTQSDLVSMSIIPFTTRISDLMFVADLFVTKPGPNACYEALHFGLPILVDGTMPAMFWERASLDLVLASGNGCMIKNTKQLSTLIKQYLDTKKTTNYQENNFEKTLKKTIALVLGHQKQEQETVSVVKTPNSNVIKPAQAS